MKYISAFTESSVTFILFFLKGGQKTASRVSKQLTRLSNSIKKSAKEYNSLAALNDVPSKYPSQLQLEDALDVKHSVYRLLDLDIMEQVD